MTSKTDSNNLATAVTETLITQAERIVRSHDDFCIGYYETTEPWCSAAPVGTPLCRGCRALADKIAKAMRTLHQERDAGFCEAHGPTPGVCPCCEAVHQSDLRQAAEAETRTLRATIQAFLDKWVEVKPHISAQFGLNFVRSQVQYAGPTLVKELADLRAALTVSPQWKDT